MFGYESQKLLSLSLRFASPFFHFYCWLLMLSIRLSVCELLISRICASSSRFFFGGEVGVVWVLVLLLVSFWLIVFHWLLDSDFISMPFLVLLMMCVCSPLNVWSSFFHRFCSVYLFCPRFFFCFYSKKFFYTRYTIACSHLNGCVYQSIHPFHTSVYGRMLWGKRIENKTIFCLQSARHTGFMAFIDQSRNSRQIIYYFNCLSFT